MQPLYLDIAGYIREAILTGSHEIGDKIPGEYSLMKQYSVGRETVRRALQLLVNEGFLLRRPGKGTFVCRKRREDRLEEAVSFTAEIISRGYIPSSKVERMETIAADATLASALQICEGEKLYYLERTRYAGEIPLAFEQSYILKSIVPGLKKSDCGGSLYEMFTHKLGITFTKMIQDVKPELLQEFLAKKYELKIMPVLILKRTIFTLQNKPFYYLNFVLRGDMYTLHDEVAF